MNEHRSGSAPHQQIQQDIPTTVSLRPETGQGATGGDSHQQTAEDTAVAHVDTKVSAFKAIYGIMLMCVGICVYL